ncbi:hypothetical protein JXA40_07070 [bacterium]|nr:hypothetical protein [candidate division CSSED10-310 bacterium]
MMEPDRSKIHVPSDSDLTAARPKPFRAALIFLVLAIIGTLPLIWQLNDIAVGDDNDGPPFIWNLWWFDKSLTDLHSDPYDCPWVFHPAGTALTFHTFMPAMNLLALPVVRLFGLIPAHNLLCMAGFFLCGFNTYLLCYYLTRDRAASFVAGFAFACSPFHYSKTAGFFNFFHMEWIPLFCLGLWLWLDRGEKRWFWTALAGAVLTVYTEYNQFVFIILWAAMYLVFRMIEKPLRSGRLIIRSLALGLAVAAAMSPIVIKALVELKHEDFISAPLEFSDRASPDLLDYLLPPRLHPVLGKFYSLTGISESPDLAEYTLTPGIVPLIAIAWFVFFPRKSRSQWFWIAATALFFMLSLGPYLHLGGHSRFQVGGLEFRVPLPYMWFHSIPIVKSARISARFHTMTTLGIAVIMGYVVALIRRQERWNRAVHKAAGIAILTIFVFEYLHVPLPVTTDLDAPAVYRVAGDIPGDFALLNVPISLRNGLLVYADNATRTLFFQTVHHKRIFGGYLSRVPGGIMEYSRNFPGIRCLIAAQNGFAVPDWIVQNDMEITRDSFEFLNLRYILFDTASLNRGTPVLDAETAAEMKRLIRRLLPIDPVYREPGYTLYHTGIGRSYHNPERITPTDRLWRRYLLSGWVPEDYTRGFQSADWVCSGNIGRIIVPNPFHSKMQVDLDISPAQTGEPDPLTVRISVNGRFQSQSRFTSRTILPVILEELNAFSTISIEIQNRPPVVPVPRYMSLPEGFDPDRTNISVFSGYNGSETSLYISVNGRLNSHSGYGVFCTACRPDGRLEPFFQKFETGWETTLTEWLTNRPDTELIAIAKSGQEKPSQPVRLESLLRLLGAADAERFNDRPYYTLIGHRNLPAGFAVEGFSSELTLIHCGMPLISCSPVLKLHEIRIRDQEGRRWEVDQVLQRVDPVNTP